MINPWFDKKQKKRDPFGKLFFSSSEQELFSPSSERTPTDTRTAFVSAIITNLPPFGPFLGCQLRPPNYRLRYNLVCLHATHARTTDNDDGVIRDIKRENNE